MKQQQRRTAPAFLDVELNGELVWFMSSLEQGAEGHYMPILISSQ
jgi:hypothetical protein